MPVLFNLASMFVGHSYWLEKVGHIPRQACLCEPAAEGTYPCYICWSGKLAYVSGCSGWGLACPWLGKHAYGSD